MAKEYLAQIISNKGTSTFSSNRFNWQDLKPELARNKTYRGLVSSFTNKFSFVKEMRRLMRDLWDSEGVNAFAQLIIKVSNKNAERNSYRQIGENQIFTANFVDAEIDELRADINFEDTGFVNDFFAGHKTKLNFDAPTNLKGGVMSGYASDLDTITLHDRTIRLFTEYIREGGFFTTPFLADDSYQTLIFGKNSDEDSKETIAYKTSSPDTFPLADSLFYLKAEKNKALTISFRVAGVISDNIGSRTYSLYIKHFDQNDDFKAEYLLGSGDGDIDENVLITYNNTIEVLIGESLGLYWESDQILVINGSLLGFDFYLNYETIDYFPQTIAQCIKPLRLFRRLTEIITGDPDAFYSDLFGLIDDGYTGDGEWANLVSLNGKMIRAFPFEDNPYNATFEDVFKYYNAITPLSLSIENIGGKQRIRIEKYEDLYDSGIIVELGGTINELNRRVREDQIFTDIIVGYKDQLYEEVNGLDSAHGEMNLTTPLNSKDKKYDIKCKARAGGYDIELARRSQSSNTSTTDTRYDKDNYLIDAYEVSGNLVARKDELFSSITGIFNPQYVYNARLFPKRNALRHGGLIKESLTRNDIDSLIYTKGSNNPNVISQLLTESEPVVEKDNVLIADLTRPKVLAELLSITTPLTLVQFNLISLNKNKLVTFVDISEKTLSIYIDELKYDEPKGEAEITGIRANR
jgi:hypothetical protein